MIRRRVGAVTLAAGLVLGPTTLTSCEREDRQDIENIKEDVKKGLDEIEDKVDKGVDGDGGNN
jgi:hypothetical protein